MSDPIVAQFNYRGHKFRLTCDTENNYNVLKFMPKNERNKRVVVPSAEQLVEILESKIIFLEKIEKTDHRLYPIYQKCRDIMRDHSYQKFILDGGRIKKILDENNNVIDRKIESSYFIGVDIHSSVPEIDLYGIHYMEDFTYKGNGTINQSIHPYFKSWKKFPSYNLKIKKADLGKSEDIAQKMVFNVNYDFKLEGAEGVFNIALDRQEPASIYW